MNRLITLLAFLFASATAHGQPAASTADVDQAVRAIQAAQRALVEALAALKQTPPPPVDPPDPVAATVKLRFGNSGCTATIVGPRRPDGRWDVLTAAHCTGNLGSKGTITLKNGQSLAVTVTARATGPDLAWLVTDLVLEKLPFATLAPANPAPGTPVWHMGYGTDRPGNREEGTVTRGPDSNGQLQIHLSVSPGDSGSGIFRADTGELVAVTCCTSSLARPGAMWGGASTTAIPLRPRVTQTGSVIPDRLHPVLDLTEVEPVPMPVRQQAGGPPGKSCQCARVEP